MPALPLRFDTKLSPALSFGLLLVAFCLIFGGFFPLPSYRMGHDYALAMPALYDGLLWYRNNGMAAPWFTPAFCAGQPFFADPQSGYYSFLQLFALLANPVAASYLTLVACATAAYWGGYLLMRRAFDTDVASAILVGGLLMFNGFLPHRLIVGHLGFHGVAFLPWLALLLLMPLQRRMNRLAAAWGAGLILAYFVQGGMGTLMLPAGLAVFVLALIRHLQRACLGEFLLRTTLAITVALALSAAKLSAAAALMSNLPRDYYPLPGAASPFDAMVMLMASLFLPSVTAYDIVTPRLANVRWSLTPHEWAYGFTLATALLLAILLWTQRRRLAARIARQWPWFLLLLACLVWPLAYGTYAPGWNAFLKSLPILGSASTPTRWMIVYIPCVALGTGLLLAHTNWSPRRRLAVVTATLLGTVALTALEPRAYYSNQDYDVTPALAAGAQYRAGRIAPHIYSLGNSAELGVGEHVLRLHGNDTAFAGVSQTYCYNPLFGYRLEKYSAAGLRTDDVLAMQDGYLNLKNPACYVFPQENGCQPGDRFRADQIEEARRFAAYKPYAFAISARQAAADAITRWGLVLCGGFGLFWLALTLLRRRHNNGSRAI